MAAVTDAGGRPYGADLTVPAEFEGEAEKLSHGELAGRIPLDYRDPVDELLRPRHRTRARVAVRQCRIG